MTTDYVDYITEDTNLFFTVHFYVCTPPQCITILGLSNQNYWTSPRHCTHVLRGHGQELNGYPYHNSWIAVSDMCLTEAVSLTGIPNLNFMTSLVFFFERPILGHHTKAHIS